jgi:hypothetical protein
MNIPIPPALLKDYNESMQDDGIPDGGFNRCTLPTLILCAKGCSKKPTK